ncbi:uncharacterized protein BN558_02235 [Clostridium sp. CAG:242]|nr:uncharacterized protein BN558_02235 [Clostridium sp. CAG:242]
MTFCVICHLFIKSRHNLICHINYGNAQTFCSQVFCCFQTDKAAACDYCTFCSGTLNIVSELDCVIRGAHGEYAWQRYALKRRNDRRSTACDDTFIIRIGFFHAGTQIFCSQLFCGCIQRGNFSFYQNLCTGQLGKFSRCIDNQLFFFWNQSTNIIWQATASIGNVLSLGEDGNIRCRIHAF